MNFFKQPYVYAVIFTFILLAATSYVLLDTFVIEHRIQSVENTKDTKKTDNTQNAVVSQNSEPSQNFGTQSTGTAQDSETSQNSETQSAGTSHQAEITENTYTDENISITIQILREYDTTIYAADITLSDPALIKTAMADDSFGTNVTEKTSAMASRVNAILAVNGDYYGANSKGYVIKNGILYRDTVRSDSQYADLALWSDGSLSFINEADISAQTLLENGVTQLFAFGPVLIDNSAVTVTADAEVGRAKASNPRTAIGIIDDGHYVFVVSDGRTSESAGLSLYALAGIMEALGCKMAYNLDGGGSSTMYFNGKVINKPTTSGRKTSEREVSDIVYIGY